MLPTLSRTDPALTLRRRAFRQGRLRALLGGAVRAAGAATAGAATVATVATAATAAAAAAAGTLARRNPLSVVAVAGTSMAPTLLPGDCLLVRRGAPVRAGSLVVAERPGRPGLLMVKRAAYAVGDRWWLLGDNPAASDDSRLFGPVEPSATVLLRYWPVRRRS